MEADHAGDPVQRAYQAAVEKYKLMNHQDSQAQPAINGQSSTDSPSTSQKTTNDNSLLAQAVPSLQQPKCAKNTYSRNELLDIAELNPDAGNHNILPILQQFGLLHDQNIPNTNAKQQKQPQQSGAQAFARPNGLGKFDTQDTKPLEGEQAVQLLQEAVEPSYQHALGNEQYSEADWAAYWQYYGYTVPPPTPPPAPQLCPTHIKLLEQMLSASTEQHQAPSAEQSQAPSAAQATQAAASTVARNALQSRAQGIQGGDLSELLMAWFDAGYQTGKHEAQLQRQ